MMTNAATTPAFRQQAAATVTRQAAQQVVIVNGSPQMLATLEPALDAGHYDIVFVESSEHAYSQIKRVQPDLVVLCLRLDDLEGFQVLSMLKLDEETRLIPILTCASETCDEDVEEDGAEPSEGPLFQAAKAAIWMN